MGIATSMKDLMQDILTTSDDRTARIEDLKVETKTLRRNAAGLVKDFTGLRYAVAHELRQQFARTSADRMKEVGESLNDAREMVQNFHDARLEAGNQLMGELAEFAEGLTSGEKERKQDVARLIDDFRDSRHKNGAYLRKSLGKSRTDMKADVRKTLAAADSQLKANHLSRQNLATNQKKELLKNRSSRKAEVTDMLSDFRGVQDGLRAELKEASDSWKEMTTAIRAKKAGTKNPAVKARGPAVKASDLKENILSIINKHNEGITLTEVAKTLGKSVLALGKATRGLLDQEKIRKDGKLYFPGIA